jgi:hypothetical protein
LTRFNETPLLFAQLSVHKSSKFVKRLWLLKINVLVRLRSLVRPPNVAIFERVRIVSVIIQRTSVVIERFELAIAPHHYAAAKENENLKDYPEDQDRRQQRLIEAEADSRCF